MIYLLALSILTNVAVVAVAFRFAGDRELSVRTDRDKLLATIDELCQRVQAPDLAVIDHQTKQGGPINPPAVGFDNDADFWEAQEMTKEQLAEAMMAQETSAR